MHEQYSRRGNELLLQRTPPQWPYVLRIRRTLRQSLWGTYKEHRRGNQRFMDDDVVETPTRALLPRFSIRVLFWVITICALACVILGLAARGEVWALGASIGLASLVITALVHAAWFTLVWLFSRLPSARPKELR